MDAALQRHLALLGLPARPAIWPDKWDAAVADVVWPHVDASWEAAWCEHLRNHPFLPTTGEHALTRALVASLQGELVAWGSCLGGMRSMGAWASAFLPGTMALRAIAQLDHARPLDAHVWAVMGEPFLECIEHGLGVFWILPTCIVALPRPALRIEGGALHAADGPAATFASGECAWFWRGVHVPQDVVEHPAGITLAAIDAEPNVEVRRVMIERFGWDRFDAEAGGELLDHHPRWGTLRRRRWRNDARSSFFDPLADTYLVVTNRSPEPDGGFRRYVLPVHPLLCPLPDPDDLYGRLGDPQALTALNAVASTFGMRGEEYARRLGAES